MGGCAGQIWTTFLSRRLIARRFALAKSAFYFFFRLSIVLLLKMN
jgi:hypothetical protein